MNIAIIFAGGVGKRMHAKDKPKQFLMVHGKPIIVHTVEVFQNHSEIDGIIVVCVKDWIDYMEEMKYRYRLDKIGAIVQGGETGQLSIYNGLEAAARIYGVEKNIVLIHDGVRPLVSKKTISDNIISVKKYGNAVTCAPTKESVVLISEEGSIEEVVERNAARTAKAPESFYLKDILEASKESIEKGINNEIDSCTLMFHHGMKMHVVEGEYDNIKITTPEDFFTFRAIYDARENEQLL
ncbi:Putative 2-C-methyl-D-erythritol 4-phosphate cytidylyltransferase 2 [uncultured Clostridium sp.]|nr:Putative 2-C-methyl-D-erythritol 4-phosphate cytidylyltransferase 2 [uncultured Clostridium sp.]